MKILESKKGEITTEGTFILLICVLAIAVVLHVFPVFTAKQNLNIYAQELCRTAEIAGQVGEETTERAKELTDDTGLSPKIEWSQTGKIQLGEKISVTCTVTKNIGLFAGIGSVPVKIPASASGKSEVYWK